MKNLTLFPMQSYKGKTVGVAISVLSMILMILASKLDNFILIKSFDNSQHFQLFFGLTVLGLYLIAYSKEKIDDERVQKIRSKSLQISFGILISILLVINFVGIISPSFSINAGTHLFLIAAIGLLIYLFFFYVALYFDPTWTYNDDTVLANVKKNKLFFLLYTLVIIVLVVLQFIL